MAVDVGIISFGAYIPRRRLQRSTIYAANRWFAPGMKGFARGEKAIANWDEDAVTMAVEAGRDCLADADASDVKVLSLASTTLPFVDRLNTGIAKEALNLHDDVAANDATGSLRAATSLLMQALAGKQTHLCLAADTRKARPASEGEMMQGDGAAAVLVGEGQLLAKYVGGHSKTIDFVDHFRQSGEDFDYAWESRWVRDEGQTPIIGDTINETLKQLNLTNDDIDHVLMAAPMRVVSKPILKATGFAPEKVSSLYYEEIGYAGAAHPLLLLASALETAKAGEKILLVAFGQGADVLVFEATSNVRKKSNRVGFSGWLANKEVDENYNRYLFHRGLLDIEKGMRAEFDEKQSGTTLARDRKTVLGLIGGKCSKTGVVQFPKTDISVAQNDRSQNTQEDYPLSNKRAQIFSYTADRLTYSMDPPAYYGLIDFEGGGRMIAEFTDVSAEEVEVGKPMRMSFRIKAKDEMRHFTKYFWKAVPIRN